MKKQYYTILLILISTIVSICLTGCEEISIPPYQGSHIRALRDYEEIEDKQIYAFDTYSQFNKSEFAKQSFSIWGIEAKKSWYSKEFFKTRKLLLVKFNAESNDEFFINKISEIDGGYKVELTRLKSKNDGVPTTFMCRLEMETEKSVRDAEVEFVLTEKPKVSPYGMLRLDESKPKICFEKFFNYEEFEAYRQTLEKPYDLLYEKYDSAFFDENDLLIAYFAAFSYGYFSADVIDGTFNLYAYSTKHYMIEDDKDTTYHMPVVAPKGQLPVNYRYYTYWEAELGDSGEPTVLEGDIVGASKTDYLSGEIGLKDLSYQGAKFKKIPTVEMYGTRMVLAGRIPGLY